MYLLALTIQSFIYFLEYIVKKYDITHCTSSGLQKKTSVVAVYCYTESKIILPSKKLFQQCYL